MIALGFKSHQCLADMWKIQLGCHAGHQEVSRCHTRGESQGMCNVTCMPQLSSNKAEPTLALKPKGDVSQSVQNRVSVAMGDAPRKGLTSSKKNFKKKSFPLTEKVGISDDDKLVTVESRNSRFQYKLNICHSIKIEIEMTDFCQYFFSNLS